MPPKQAVAAETVAVELNPDLAGLANLAAGVDEEVREVEQPGQAGDAAMPGAPQGPDYLTEARSMVDLGGALVTGYCPEAVVHWSDETKGNMAASLAPVMEKYGWTTGGMPVELTAALVCGPVVWASAQLIKAKIARERAAAIEAAQPPRPREPAPFSSPIVPRETAPASAEQTPPIPGETAGQMALSKSLPVFPEM